ncbi:MAG TPA: AMP-binding protein, partial [Elusimicrobiota bacterium]|nr:AMP-binding protein [Elusimicrobiota bacterium]
MLHENLNQMLADAVKQSGDAAAFLFKDEPILYRDLDDKIRRCAAGLAALGIGKDDTFGIVLRNCPEFVIAFFALSRLGAVAVPVNFLEKGERLGYIFHDAGVKGCLTAREFLGNVREAQKRVPTLKHLFLKTAGHDLPAFDSLLHQGDPPPEHPVAPNDLAMLIYTAGTTGSPKGVMLTHKNFVANVESCRKAIELSSADRFMCVLPMFHSFAWTTNVLLPLRLGAGTVIIESLLPFEPVLHTIWKHNVNVFCGVPPIFSTLTQKVKGLKAMALRLINPVRLVVSGAAPLPAGVQKKFEETFGTPLLEGYGLTEAAPVVSLNPLHGARKDGSVGLPLPDVRVKIVDDEERLLPDGQVGEICVKGDNVMAGYYKRPQETREAFTKDGWLKTGDLGLLEADGYLRIVDRKKDLIIVKGLNVYPQEVETVLRSHPAVDEAAVVGIYDSESGDETVKAFVTLKRDAA